MGENDNHSHLYNRTNLFSFVDGSVKKFKLFDYRYSRDYGHDLFLYFGCYNRRWTLLQLCFGWSEYGAMPFFRFDLGLNHLMSVLLWFYKFTFEICVAGNAYYPESALRGEDT